MCKFTRKGTRPLVSERAIILYISIHIPGNQCFFAVNSLVFLGKLNRESIKSNLAGGKLNALHD